jgi:BirA family biotin operon repressor/biotin-[acetyl-CoA-carboxylase] ligase
MGVESEMLPRGIQAILETTSFGRRMYYLPSVDSTNRLAKELATQGEREGAVVLADFQSAGRGRRRRRWISPPGSGLLFSLIVRPERSPVDTLAMTLTFSLAIADALSERLGQELGVKWPNDVVSPKGKICGILSESSSRAGRLSFVVVGVGVNVNTAPDELPADIAAASCYSLTGTTHDRQRLLARLLGELERTYQSFLGAGFTPFVGRYKERLSVINRTVEFGSGDRRSSGEVLDVRDDGGLVILTDDGGPVVLYDEEVTLTE